MATKKKAEAPKGPAMTYESRRAPNLRHLLRVEARKTEDGTVDVAQLVPFKGVFAPLKDSAVFAKVELDLKAPAFIGDHVGREPAGRHI